MIRNGEIIFKVLPESISMFICEESGVIPFLLGSKKILAALPNTKPIKWAHLRATISVLGSLNLEDPPFQ